jgi:hypothetical protein
LSAESKYVGRVAASGDPTLVRTGPRGSFIFIHINKTGGTSIGRAIGLPKKRHLSARQVIDLVGEEAWARAYKFAFVRNPWDKVVSQYEFRVRTNQTRMGERRISFKDWVLRTIGGRQDAEYFDRPHLFQPQVEWLTDHAGRVSMQRIGRFERLARDFAEICGDLGIAPAIPHLNRTERRTDYRDYYDRETAEVVARWYRADIERFGYAFDAPAGGPRPSAPGASVGRT